MFCWKKRTNAYINAMLASEVVCSAALDLDSWRSLSAFRRSRFTSSMGVESVSCRCAFRVGWSWGPLLLWPMDCNLDFDTWLWNIGGKWVGDEAVLLNMFADALFELALLQGSTLTGIHMVLLFTSILTTPAQKMHWFCWDLLGRWLCACMHACTHVITIFQVTPVYTYEAPSHAMRVDNQTSKDMLGNTKPISGVSVLIKRLGSCWQTAIAPSIFFLG